MSQSIEKSRELATTYFAGVNSWLDNKFLAEEQKTALLKHFAELLLRYKVFVNTVADGGDATQAAESIKAWAGVLPEYAVKQGG